MIIFSKVTESSKYKDYLQTIKGKYYYSYDEDIWYFWNGNTWSIVGANIILNDITEYLDTQGLIWQTASKRNNIYSYVKNDPIICSVSSYKFDNNPFLLNTLSGTVDLKEVKFIKPNREHMVLGNTGFKVSEEENCPTFLKHIKEFCEYDSAYIRYIKQIFGNILSGNQTQNFYFLYGLGGSGKGTLLDAIKISLGDYATEAEGSYLERGTNDFETADFFGKRMVICSEVLGGIKYNESRIKRISGGDDIKAASKGKKGICFVNNISLFISGNKIPDLSPDSGIKRRMIVLPCNYQPDSISIGRRQYLRSGKESPGILRWMLNGLKDYNENGFIVPEVVKNETEKVTYNLDLFEQFLQNECEKIGLNDSYYHFAHTAQEYMSAYNHYCSRNREKEISKRELFDILKNHKIENKAVFKNNRTEKLWVGYKIKKFSFKGENNG